MPENKCDHKAGVLVAALDYYLETDYKKRPKSPARQMLIESLNDFSECIVSQIAKTKKRGSRKPSARNNYIGNCMTKPENGGQGKDMKNCSDNWKQMPDEEKVKF